MNKFWEWMIKNKYCTCARSIDCSLKHESVKRTREFTTQMIIGYKLEYLRDVVNDDGNLGFFYTEDMGKIGISYIEAFNNALSEKIEEYE